MSLTFNLASALNSAGERMTLEYTPTCSWQSFAIRGLPPKMAGYEGKGFALSKAVETWTICVKNRPDALQISAVSARIRKVLDEAKAARIAAAKSRPQVNF